MTPRMHADLIQFGDVIFIDAQQHQFKSSVYPYISPVLHDDKGKIAQGVKSMHTIYAWVLTKMVRLESWFQLDQIWIIFADVGIPPTLFFTRICRSMRPVF
jgi:hypothetical protein